VFEESVQLSVSTPVWILAFIITDCTFWKYDQHKKCHLEISSEQVSNIHFCCSDQLRGKKTLQYIAQIKFTDHSSYHIKPCKLYFVLKLL